MTKVRARLGRIGSKVRAGLGRIGSAAAWPFGAARRWWDGFDSAEGQVATLGLVLLGVGLQWSLIGLAVPGAILTAIGMGFNLRRRSS